MSSQWDRCKVGDKVMHIKPYHLFYGSMGVVISKSRDFVRIDWSHGIVGHYSLLNINNYIRLVGLYKHKNKPDLSSRR